MTQVSTAYVNANISGRIEEKIYDLTDKKDPEQVVSEILKLHPLQVSEQEK